MQSCPGWQKVMEPVQARIQALTFDHKCLLREIEEGQNYASVVLEPLQVQQLTMKLNALDGCIQEQELTVSSYLATKQGLINVTDVVSSAFMGPIYFSASRFVHLHILTKQHL